MRPFAAGALFASLVLPTISPAQDLGHQAKSRPYVAYESGSHAVAAGTNAVIELHFRVQDGFHVNSHTPKSDYLLPTKLELGSVEGVKAAALEYSAGMPYSFSFEPNEKLDVYSGPFTVKVPLVATAGEHKLSGTLRYQACDQAACYPPKNLPVAVLFTAK